MNSRTKNFIIFFVGAIIIVFSIRVFSYWLIGEQNRAVSRNWTPFQSSYFNIAFKVPLGFEVKDTPNQILIAKSPFIITSIGSNNAFFTLTKYSQEFNREERINYYQHFLKDTSQRNTLLGDKIFPIIYGNDTGRFEGKSAGKVTVIFLNEGWLEVIERPMGTDQSFDAYETGSDILNTLKFTSIPTATQRLEVPFTFVGKRPTGPNADLYKGSVVVEGEYQEWYPETMGGGILFFKVDEQYRAKLPIKYGEHGQVFIFDNDPAAKQMLKVNESVFNNKSICKLSGRAKIEIEDYTTELLEGDVWDHTKLVQVISSTSQTTKTCSERQ